MGFWNIKAGDLKIGDEIRIGSVGAEDFITALEMDPDPNEGIINVRLSTGVWEPIDYEEPLVVRR
jgi:hypothetical protein